MAFRITLFTDDGVLQHDISDEENTRLRLELEKDNEFISFMDEKSKYIVIRKIRINRVEIDPYVH